MNPSLKAKNKIKQNQQLEGQISGSSNTGAASNKRTTQKTQYDYDLTYHDTNGSALGMNTSNSKNYSKKTSSGSMPLKYGSETRAQQEPKGQMLSQVMPAFGSRNNLNSSNTNPQNQTLYTNISLREISHSPDAAGRRDDNSNVADAKALQQRKASNTNKRSKKIQITSGKHGILNLQNANVINNSQKQLNRTGGAASAAGNIGVPAGGNMLQMNTQAPIDLNMSNLSHNVEAPQNMTHGQMGNMLNNQRLYSNNSDLVQHNMMMGQGHGRGSAQQDAGQGLELRQYLANINSGGSNLRNNGSLAQIPEMINGQQNNHYLDNATPGSKLNGVRSNSEGPNNKNAQSSNPILNIKTVQDINIYNNSFIVNTNNPNLQNLQSQAQMQQM